MMTYQEAADLFGLSLDTLTKRGVKVAYRELAKKYHPEKSDAPNAKEKMIQINAAKELLEKYIDIYGEGKPETSIVPGTEQGVVSQEEDGSAGARSTKKKREKRAKKDNKPKIRFSFPRIFSQNRLEWALIIIALFLLVAEITYSVYDTRKFDKKMEEIDRQHEQRMKEKRERQAHAKHVQDSLLAIYPDYKFKDTLYVTSARLIRDDWYTYVAAELMDENGKIIHLKDSNQNGTIFHSAPGICVVRDGTQRTIPGQEKTTYGMPNERLTPLQSEMWARSHGLIK